MSMDVGKQPISCRNHTGASFTSWGNLPPRGRPPSNPFDLSLPHRSDARQQSDLDSEPSGSDANPGIAGALTFARSTPTRPESVGGPRFFRTHHAWADDPNCHRPGMNRTVVREGRNDSGSSRNDTSVQESVVRTRPRVLPSVGIGGTSRTWLTRDDVRVARSHF